MRYKIRDINKRKNTGRTDTSMVGRIVEFDLDEIRRLIGSSEPVYIKCITDCNGNKYSPKQQVRMRLINIMSINWFYGKKVITIEDRDSYYTFDKVK